VTVYACNITTALRPVKWKQNCCSNFTDKYYKFLVSDGNTAAVVA